MQDYEQLFQDIQEYTISLPKSKPAELIIMIFEFIKDKLGKRVWVERTGASSDFLGQWKNIWPNLKVIHIYRDGRDCAISMSKHHAFRLQVLRKRRHENTTFYKFTPIPSESFTLEEFYNHDIGIEEFGSLWSSMINYTLDEIAEIPKARVLDISYEQLVEDPKTQLSRLASFISPLLETEEWVKEQCKVLHRGRSNWKIMDRNEVVKLTLACEEGLSRLGYI